MGCGTFRIAVRGSGARGPQSRPAGQSARRPFRTWPVAKMPKTMTVAVRRWRSSNCWLGRPYGPAIAFVLHSETGGESGTVAEFLNSSSQWSSHYTVGLDGTLDCYVDPGDRAWSNGVLEPGNSWTSVAEACGVDVALNPNHVTVSCETEDLGAPDQ